MIWPFIIAILNSEHLNITAKVERSHNTNKMEFCQLLDQTVDVNLKTRLSKWEAFYNYARPHVAMNGKTPYERLKEKLC
ncbi:integrase core domain-containing protein [Acinetobacter bereziniae]|uniref:integrase core domain-containing protein n=1 Tax=Acinetobacter bereziniae TaxID=106648 RepID=UPI0039C48476